MQFKDNSLQQASEENECRLTAIGDIRIITLRTMSDNFIHMLCSSREAVAVDPGSEQPVLNFIQKEGLTLSLVLLTHHHSDHIAGCKALKAATQCLITGPQDHRIPFLDRIVDNDEEFSALSTMVRAIATPGHTKTHTCYHIQEHKTLFTGDTLFPGGCGRLFEGSPAEMWRSLLKLKNLPPDTRIFAGHDYTADNLAFGQSIMPSNKNITKRLDALKTDPSPCFSTLSEELSTNVFLMSDSQELLKQTDLSGTPETVFTELRKRKDQW